MSDKIKITDLDILEDIAGADWVVVVDVSDTSQSPEGTTKRVRKDLLKGVNWQGDWVAGSYVSDDGVSHNGSSWIANKNTSEEPSISATDWDILAIKGDTGDTGPQGIQGIQGEKGNNWQGPWVPGTYQIDDVVENDGSSWIAIAETTEEPSNLATDWELFAAKGVDGAGAGDMLKVNYDPANKNVDVFDMDNMDEGADTKIMTAAERAKLGHIAVTQPVDLDQMEADIAALANGMVYKGNWDASSGSFPGAGVAQVGWFYTVSVGSTVDGVVFVAGDRLIATVDNASTTTFAGNWTQVDATDAVQSVAGLVGVILASALRAALNVGEIIDEDDMVSNSATKVPSQQSVKAYVDNKVPNVNFGDGSDGDVIISSPTTLVRDMYYNNLTVNSTLTTDGYRIFVKQTIDGSGTINWGTPNNGVVGGTGVNSANASGGAGGAASGSGQLKNIAGVSGGLGASTGGAGTAGLVTTECIGSNGAAGGAGAGGGGGGAVGTVTPPFKRFGILIQRTIDLVDLTSANIFAIIKPQAGSSGGGGAGAGGASISNRSHGGGGGSGATGGIILICANTWAGTFTISNVGGNGGNGGPASVSAGWNRGGGGGAGGNGGVNVVVFSTKTWTGSHVLTGGAGGAGGVAGGANPTSGSAGSAGNTGSSYEINFANLL